jgi:molybdopterin molybdotransferase
VISVEEAEVTIVSAVRPLPSEMVGIDAALGRVLASNVAARRTQPPVDISAMDGYALRAEDAFAGARLTVIGQAAAGAGYVDPVGAGESVRIFTGAPIPAGADTVLIQENTEVSQTAGASAIVVRVPPQPGQHIRRRGQDFAEGDTLLCAGRRLSPRDVGLAAAMNVLWLPVRRRPRVAVLANGNELVMPGEWTEAKHIVNAAGFLAAALLRSFGAEPQVLGIVPDEAGALGASLAAAEGCDLLLTIGGASVGEMDLIAPVLSSRGFDLVFHKVAMRPGKPLLFGRLKTMPVLGLPGNPVSAGVIMMLFVRPAIEAMLGLLPRGPLPTARLGTTLPANDGRQDYLRASLQRDASGDAVATPLPVQDSAQLRAFAEAQCLILRPPMARPAERGEQVSIVPLDDTASPL